ncbi:putative metal chaperone, involved in Fe-nitrile hydratase activation, GTPase of COG0523 family [Rhodovulum sp. PH10]|uniref:nitrile hydratase accessory protein n=1 Tax=Rhodovulum sp. PH10 TaxID=1187851 RepID=UPI00027C2ADD|nr:nitrile hydratase accessory protein [Rhodovulum sp. PH10]EJW12857.1 putative metal chaperone, involved in Fe-nitrile hydratase activation, GTPase of COG0523 family [Rhodovulum sp. PH10]
MTEHRDTTSAAGSELSDPDLRIRALASLVADKGCVEAGALDGFVDVYMTRVVPAEAEAAAAAAPADGDAGLPDATLGARAMMAIPRDSVGPLFRDRWEAHAFVLATVLEQRGVFSWAEWAPVLGGTLRRLRGDPATEKASYYEVWLDALESMAAHKGLADAAALTRYRHAWDEAAARTPQGAPIRLRPEDFQ